MNSTKNPFYLEDLRTELAERGNLKAFSLTYVKSLGININTGTFWDKKFRSSEKYEDQDPMTKDKIDTIIAALPKKKSKILDLGIGQGYVEQRLKQLGIVHELYGIDISKKSIQRANRNFEGKFIVGNVLEINKLYKKRFFDVVIAVELIEHIPPVRIFGLYKHIRTILKRNGTFIISTPLNEGLRYMKINPSAHLREYTIPILEVEFKLSNFKITLMQTFFAFRKFYIIKKLLARIFNTWRPNSIVVTAKNLS